MAGIASFLNIFTPQLALITDRLKLELKIIENFVVGFIHRQFSSNMGSVVQRKCRSEIAKTKSCPELKLES